MKTKLLSCTLAALVAYLPASQAGPASSLGAAGATDAIAPSASAPMRMRALPSIEFDRWTQLLYSASGSAKVTRESARLRLIPLIAATRDHEALFESLLSVVRMELTPSSHEEFLILADVLIEARRGVRVNARIPVAARYAKQTLLEFLAEETLVAAADRFPGKVSSYSRGFAPIDPEFRANVRTATFHGFDVMSGDIVLSRGTGSGSSSFIALSTERPGLFSHALPLFVDQGTGELLAPEAWIEDGVRLRSVKQNYLEKSKARLFVYRARSSNRQEAVDKQQMAADGVEKFIDEMNGRVSDPKTEAAFPYNFSMDPAQMGDRFTCTEVVISAYAKGGFEERQSPWPKALWSRFGAGHRDVVSGFLGLSAETFPAPSDLDMNPAFDIVGVHYDLGVLAQERVESAAIDTLFALIASDQARIRESLKVFDEIGNNPITSAQIDYLKSLEILPADVRRQISDNVPANISIKQLVFFGYLNQVFTPKVRVKMLEDVEAFKQKHRRLPGLGELRAIAGKRTLEHIGGIKAIAAKFLELGR